MNLILKGVAFVVALQLLPVSITQAIAGDWAVAGDGCKVWNSYSTAGEKFAGPALARTGLLKVWARSNGKEARDL